MAKCPHCQAKLHFYDIKAECPKCGANIPNYNWEERLEQDAEKRERSFYNMHTVIASLKFAVCGNVFRTLRLVFSFIPIVAYLLTPAALSVVGRGEQPFELGRFGILSVILDKVDVGALFEMLKSPQEKSAAVFAAAGAIMYVLSLAVAVVAFFLIFILHKRPRSPAQAVLHALSLVLYAACPFMIIEFAKRLSLISPIEAAASFSPLAAVGILLYLVVFVFDIINAKRPLSPTDGKYIPSDELQHEYGVSIGAIAPDEWPEPKVKKSKKGKEVG